MSIPVNITIANPDPTIPFTNPTDLMTLQRLLFTAQISEALSIYVISAITPAVDDQDKLWYRLDSMTGGPIGLYFFYLGRWVLTPPGPGNRLTWFVGDPTTFFDSTGLGLPGSGDVMLDYFGWAIANGNNGTINMTDRMFIGAQLDALSLGWDSGTSAWQTTVEGGANTVAGAATITLDGTNTYRPATPAITVGGWQADGNTGATDAGLFGNNNAGTHPHTLLSADAGVPTPPAISIMNPYYAVAVLQFIGYPSS